MSPWQLLCAGRATRAARGHRAHHGPGGSLHHGSAPHSSSREKLHRLNRRLASYLQQVQCLEAANGRLERQIQEELDRKCPGQLSELDGRLRTASRLQEQISECLSAHAQVKLQLLAAELAVFDLSSRCEKERECRGRVEAKLGDLRLLGEELQVHRLPELHRLLHDQTQLLTELKMKHQQDVQRLQASGGVAVTLQTVESSDLMQQLDALRRTSADMKHSKRRFDAQASWRSLAEVTFDPAARAELQELRSTAGSLEAELKQLQALNMALEASSLDRAESVALQLAVLQQRADGLSGELDLVLRAAAQQAADYQVLLGVRTRLETEMQTYRTLLDGLNPQEGVSGLCSVSAANAASSRAAYGPSAFRRNITESKTINSQEETVSGRHVHTVKQTPTVAKLLGNVASVQSTWSHNKYAKKSPVRSVNTAYLKGSFNKSENQRGGGALHEITGKEPTTADTAISRQSSSVEDKVHYEDCDLVQASIVSTQISQGLDETASTPEIITALVPDTHSARGTSVQAKPEMVTSKQTGQAVSQADEAERNIQMENTETILCVEVVTERDPSKQTAAGVKTEAETVTSAQMNSTEGSIQVKNRDPANGSPGEAVGDAGEVEVTASVVSGSHTVRLQETQVNVSGGVTVIEDRDVERQEKQVEEEIRVDGTLLVLTSDQSSALSSASHCKKVLEDADTESGPAIAASVSSGKNDNLESESESTDMLQEVELEVDKREVVSGFHDANRVMVEPSEVDAEVVNPAGQEALLSAVKSKKSNKRSVTDFSVALISSRPEELLNPREAPSFARPTERPTCLSPEVCLSPVEAEVLMTMTDQLFCPVKVEEHVREPEFPLSPNNPELFSPNESDTCFSPAEDNMCFSPNGEEEDEEVCLSLTEANAHVRPVEKYIILTKESFSGDEALPQEDTEGKVRDGGSLCFGSFEENKQSTLSATNTKSGPASREICPKLSSSLGGPDSHSIIADKEKQLGFGGLYRKSVTDKKRCKDTGGTADNKALSAGSGGTAAHPAGAVGGNAETGSTAGAQGRFRRGSGEWMVYGSSPGHSSTGLPCTGSEEATNSRPETGRLSRRGSGEWMVYGGGLVRKSSLDGGSALPSERKEQGPAVAANPATSPEDAGRFGCRGTAEWMVYGGSPGRKSSSSPGTRGEESRHLATSPRDARVGSRESGERRVYGGSAGRMGSNNSAHADSRVSLSAAMQLATSPPGTPGDGRFGSGGSGGSGERRFYGRLSSAGSADGARNGSSYPKVISPPSSYTSSGPRLSGVVRRSSSVGSGGRLSSSGSGGRLSSSPGSYRSSSSGRFTGTGSGEWKPVYSSASGRRSAGQSGGGAATSGQRAPSPGGVMGASVGSGGWMSSSSTSKASSGGSNDRISGRTGGRISSSSGSGRTNSSGGRVISSSDRPIRSTGSGAGGKKERISVCKMAALSISAAGMERSQERRREAQKQQKQQQQAAATSPLVQRWLITGVGATSADPDGLDDIMRL